MFQKILSFIKPVSSLADKPIMSAADLKAWFDSNSNQVKNAFDALVDEIIAETCAEQLGAKGIAGLDGNTVQKLLEAIDERINNIIANGDSLSEIADARGVYRILRDRLNNVDAQLLKKSNQADLDTQAARVDGLVAVSGTSFYEKTTNVTAGALLVVANGAITGQINLSSVTPLATGYTPTVGDYVRLVYGVASGSTELIDTRIGLYGKKYSTSGNALRGQLADLLSPKVDIGFEQGSLASADGSPTVATNRVRSVGYVTAKTGNHIKVTNPNFLIRVFGDYAGTNQPFTDWVNEVVLSVDKTNVRFVIKKTNDANFTPIEVYGLIDTDIAEYIGVVPNVTPDMVNNLVTSYAEPKKGSFALNDIGYDFQNMCWSWWYYPQVISHKNIRNKVYFGYTTNEGHTGIAEYNIDTGEKKRVHLKKNDTDDHNGCALFLMPDGRIMVAYSGGHNTDNYMHVRISKSKENIENFNDEILIDAGGTTSYGQIFYVNGTYYLFYRLNNISWCYTTSSDGVAWTVPKTLISANIQYYVKFAKTTDSNVLRMCMYSNPAAEDSNIRMGFINLSNGNIYNSDNVTVLGTLGNSISYTNFNVIIANEIGKTQRLFDVAITSPLSPKIAYAPFTDTLNDDSIYKIYDNGTIYTICNGGEAFWHPKYQGGMSFIDSNNIVLSRSWGGYDYIEKYSFNNSTWAKIEDVYSELKGITPIRNIRPIVDINKKAYLWHRGYYNVGDYTKFDMDAIIKMM